ncbi:hypothetical protein HPG69_006234, partial [Diceros bicornis minor]
MLVSASSASFINSSIFILTGFPGIDQYYPWFSIPFSSICAMYKDPADPKQDKEVVFLENVVKLLDFI